MTYLFILLLMALLGLERLRYSQLHQPYELGNLISPILPSMGKLGPKDAQDFILSHMLTRSRALSLTINNVKKKMLFST